MTRNPRRAYDADGREIEPEDMMGLRAHGVTELLVTCACGREGTVPVDRFLPETYVPDAGLRMRCVDCGRRGLDTRPAWPPGVVSTGT